MPIDIFDTEHPAPDRVFRYPLYERWLWLVVPVVGVLALAFWGRVHGFLAAEGRRGMAVAALVVVFLLATVWVSLRAWISKVIISPVSLKARVFGQGIQRVSWVHIQAVIYKWRPLGHKLVFVGSDGARVSFRSSIRGYDQLMAFIRANAPEQVLDQLDEIFGEEIVEDEGGAEEEEGREEDQEGETPESQAPQAEAAQAEAPQPEAADEEDEEDEETPEPSVEPTAESAGESGEAPEAEAEAEAAGDGGAAAAEVEAAAPQQPAAKRRWWHWLMGE